MFLPDVLRCRVCQCASESNLCDECFAVDLENELCGEGEPPLPEVVELWVPERGLSLLADICLCRFDEFGDDWAQEKIIDAVCSFGGLDVVDGQVDLVNSFDDLFFQAVQLFDATLSQLDRQRFRSWPVGRGRVVEICRLIERLKVDREKRAEEARLRRQVEILRELEERREREAAEELARARRAVKRNYAEPVEGEPPGFNLIRSDPRWQALRASWKCIFEFLFGRSRLDKSGRRFGCQVHMEWIQEGTGYGETAVREGVRGLIEAGWIGRPKRGRPMTGASWYWVTRSPKVRKKS